VGFAPARPAIAASVLVDAFVNSDSAFATVKFVLFDDPFAPEFVADRDSVDDGQYHDDKSPTDVFFGHIGMLVAFGKNSPFDPLSIKLPAPEQLDPGP
jgi:hypothetical protein